MADRHLSADYRCSYCYQELPSMTDPKVLPCHHVFCLLCLKEDFLEKSFMRCPTCHVSHELTDIDDLPKARLDVCETTATSASSMCEGVQCDGQAAVCYCIQCSQRFCDKHQQVHNSLFGNNHHVISVSDYEESPARYRKVSCSLHKQELDRVCRKCDKIVCKECDENSDRCEDNKRHTFESLEFLEKDLSALFNDLVSQAVDMITDICRLDKKLWTTLDEEEVECSRRIEMIDTSIEQQILRIKEAGEKLKKQIRDYQKRLTNQVEVYNYELITKREQLEESLKRMKRWLRDTHVTEKVRDGEEMLEKCTEDLDCELDNYQLSGKPALISTRSQAILDVTLVQVASALELRAQHKTRSECYAVCHRANGDVLVSCYNYIGFLGKSDTQLHKYTELHGTTTAVEYNNVVYVQHTVDQMCKLEMCSPDLSARHELMRYKQPSLSVAIFSVSDRYIAATNRAFSQILLYEFINGQTTTITLDLTPTVISFHTSGDLLATNFMSNVLTRYRIEDGKLTTVWVCHDLRSAYGVCTDEEGLIYVSSLRHKAIYIVSPQGEKLAELKHSKLPATTGQISVKGGEMVIPGWSDETLHMFTLKY